MKALSATLQSPGLIRRLLQLVYEAVLLLAVLIIAALPVTVVFDIRYDPAKTLFDQAKYLLFLVYIAAVVYGYFMYFWTQGRQTLAMKTWKTSLIDVQGKPLNWQSASKHFFASALNWFVLLGAGYLTILARDDRRAIHELISGTRLIRIP